MSGEAESADVLDPGEAPRASKPRAWRRLLPLRIAQAVALAVVAAVSLLFGLLHGYNYGVSNHFSYLFGGLHLLDRGLYTKDWLVSQTTNYHRAFEYVVWLLFAISRRGMAFAVASTICSATYCLLIYWIITIVVRRREALTCFLLVMAINFVTGTASAGTSYITEGILQPSSFGSLGILAGIALFLRGRWLLSGVALAIGGLMHGNYAILALLVFGLAQLVLGEEGRLKRLVAQFAPIVPVLLILAPMIVAAATDPSRLAARDILFKIRGPHHFSPKGYESAFFPVAAWEVLGLGAGGYLLRRGDAIAARLGALTVGLLAVIWCGTVATTAFDISSAQQLFVARLCPFSDVLFEIFVCAGVARVLTRPSSMGPLLEVRRRSVALVIIGLGILCMFEGNRRGGNATTGGALLVGLVSRVVAMVVVVVALGLGVDRLVRLAARWPVLNWIAQARRLSVRHGAWLVALFGAWLWYRVSADPYTAWKADAWQTRSSAADRELFSWITAQTPKDAIFLTPPEMESFRLQSRRAIVVDWKTPPFLPKEVIEWYRRLGDVAGKRVGGISDAAAGYRDLDVKRVEALRAKYGIAYVVVRRGAKLTTSGLVPAFQGRGYVVLDANAVQAAPSRPPEVPTEPDVEPPDEPPALQ